MATMKAKHAARWVSPLARQIEGYWYVPIDDARCILGEGNVS